MAASMRASMSTSGPGAEVAGVEEAPGGTSMPALAPGVRRLAGQGLADRGRRVGRAAPVRGVLVEPEADEGQAQGSALIEDLFHPDDRQKHAVRSGASSRSRASKPNAS